MYILSDRLHEIALLFSLLKSVKILHPIDITYHFFLNERVFPEGLVCKKSIQVPIYGEKKVYVNIVSIKINLPSEERQTVINMLNSTHAGGSTLKLTGPFDVVSVYNNIPGAVSQLFGVLSDKDLSHILQRPVNRSYTRGFVLFGCLF